jgi:hypothetical protein
LQWATDICETILAHIDFVGGKSRKTRSVVGIFGNATAAKLAQDFRNDIEFTAHGLWELYSLRMVQIDPD